MGSTMSQAHREYVLMFVQRTITLNMIKGHAQLAVLIPTMLIIRPISVSVIASILLQISPIIDAWINVIPTLIPLLIILPMSVLTNALLTQIIMEMIMFVSFIAKLLIPMQILSQIQPILNQSIISVNAFQDAPMPQLLILTEIH